MTHLQNDAVEAEDSMKDRFLTFSMDEDTFGIDIKHVIEIVGIQPITKMPEMPVYINGIINLRGKIVPIMDVRLRFKKPGKEYNDRTCVIVIDCGLTIGLIVDSVSEVLTIPAENIEEKPEVGSKESRGFVKSIGKTGDHEIVLLLDCEKLLNRKETDEILARL